MKRRFNFETVPPIERFEHEIALVQQETARLLKHAGVKASLAPDVAELLVTTFRELRSARTTGGMAVEVDQVAIVMTTSLCLGPNGVVLAFLSTVGGGSRLAAVANQPDKAWANWGWFWQPRQPSSFALGLAALAQHEAPRVLACPLKAERGEGIDGRLDLGDAPLGGVDQFERRDVAAFEPRPPPWRSTG